jgi:hypothetical protein
MYPNFKSPHPARGLALVLRFITIIRVYTLEVMTPEVITSCV